MCGIVGSPTLVEGASLAALVKSRGTRAWSLTLLDLNTYTILHTHQDAAAYDESHIIEAIRKWLYADAGKPNIDPYYIFHLQSPTAVDHRFHPAVLMGPNSTEHYLWHNGMIESNAHKKYERKWDTQILLEMLVDENGDPDFSRLSEFQGSFACYYLNSGKGLYAFRNMISPQFYDMSGTFCSIKFPESEKIASGEVIDMVTGKVVERFTNDVNPFGIGA